MHGSRAKIVVAPRLGDGWQHVLQVHCHNLGVDVDVSRAGCKHLLRPASLQHAGVLDAGRQAGMLQKNMSPS